jgi:hypothetical protein
MRQKIGTSLRKPLIVKAKSLALRRSKKINEVIEEALEKYLEAENNELSGSVVKATRGVIPAPKNVVDQIMEEELFFDA